MPSTPFDLHKLGWKAFEDLVACIFREVMGQSFQSFTAGPDGGRDGAFYGTWETQCGDTLSGSFTIQCKHSSKPESNLTDSRIQDELVTIEHLAAEGLADVYIFVTNMRLSGNVENTATRVIQAAGAGTARIYGPRWIDAQISENPRLRRLVPRLYGLGDLTQIMTHQAYRQARSTLEHLAPDLVSFVPTDSYRKCAHALREYGFVLLLGEPASGKTMIASLLALSAADEWGLQTLLLGGPEDFIRFWNPDDPGQFFWVDDAFGSTQYDPRRAREWNQRLPLLKTAIGKGARAIFTSRDYIFRAAMNDLKTSSFELFQDSRITIQVEHLTELERQQILYNHLKCGKQSNDFRGAVKPWLAQAAVTPKFLPEIARRFADPKFTKDVFPTEGSVKGFFNEPVEWLERVLSNLAGPEKAAIALIFIEGGRISIPIPEEAHVLRTISTMRSTVGDVKAAMNSLNDSIVRRTREDGREYWRFRHPTVQDAFAAHVGSNPELIDIYLAGVPTERLMDEVTCGDMNIDGVKIVVCRERFPAVLNKLKTVRRNPRTLFDPLSSFLRRRCSGEFLKQYFSQIEPIDSLPSQIGFLRKYDDALILLCRLHASRLLPESNRRAAVERISDLAIQWYSCEFVEAPINQLLTNEEREALLAELSDVLFSNASDIIHESKESWDEEEDPSELFSILKTTLDYFEQNETEENQLQVVEFLAEINDAILDMAAEQSDSPSFSALDAEKTPASIELHELSIFNDIDE